MRIVFYLFLFLVACKGKGTEEKVLDNNSAQTPYLVMVSIDGFRYDYANLHGAENIARIGREGVVANEGMIPAFPSKTFPNHYTLVTGLYPDKHGLVSNNFYDPAKDETYAIRDREKVEDGTWYGGTPLWVLAEQQGIKTASYFWVGTEANIKGIHPSDYYIYDGKVPDKDRVEQIIEWLKRPEETRPHLLMLYFSLVDDAGHKYGPDDPMTREAVKSVDETIGFLDQQLQQLDFPVNLLIVSDHGMHQINTLEPIFYEDFADYSQARVIHSDAIVMIHQREATLMERLYQQILKHQQKMPEKFSVYKRAQIPAHFQYGKNPRAGDIILVPNPPYIFGKKFSGMKLAKQGGTHGFDPFAVKEMRAAFYAKGPGFKQGVTIGPFENIHVYPMVAALLGLEISEKIDGRLEVLSPVLRQTADQ